MKIISFKLLLANRDQARKPNGVDAHASGLRTRNINLWPGSTCHSSDTPPTLTHHTGHAWTSVDSQIMELVLGGDVHRSSVGLRVRPETMDNWTATGMRLKRVCAERHISGAEHSAQYGIRKTMDWSYKSVFYRKYVSYYCISWIKMRLQLIRATGPQWIISCDNTVSKSLMNARQHQTLRSITGLTKIFLAVPCVNTILLT